jgi:hypothetical protein
MIVLGVESSCDETGLALYDTQRGLLSHALHSQVAMHEQYGGVVPELASRDHIRRALPLLEQVLAKGGTERQAIDAIAYTQGPGLALGYRRSMRSPIPRVPAWQARCWSVPRSPAAWAWRSTSLCWACITWKATCCRRS